jgi:hypothetical protein
MMMKKRAGREADLRAERVLPISRVSREHCPV